jgi:hypothetical protein
MRRLRRARALSSAWRRLSQEWPALLGTGSRGGESLERAKLAPHNLPANIYVAATKEARRRRRRHSIQSA